MTITNKSGMDLTVLGKTLNHGKTRDFPAKYDSGIVVFSDSGCCKIYVEDGKVKFESEGNIEAKNGMKKDRRGLRYVNISSRV